MLQTTKAFSTRAVLPVREVCDISSDVRPLPGPVSQAGPGALIHSHSRCSAMPSKAKRKAERRRVAMTTYHPIPRSRPGRAGGSTSRTVERQSRVGLNEHAQVLVARQLISYCELSLKAAAVPRRDRSEASCRRMCSAPTQTAPNVRTRVGPGV